MVFFNLTQSIWRKVQAESLQANYNNDEELALKIRYLPALAFVVPLDDREYFEAAIEHLPTTISQGLVLYFEHTLTYQKYSYRPKFPLTFSHIYLLIKESTH